MINYFKRLFQKIFLTKRMSLNQKQKGLNNVTQTQVIYINNKNEDKRNDRT